MRRARIRADPVSCQSCRSKKLKCNRVQPCTNCLARGITCDFLVPPPSSTSQCSTTHTNAELLERIERLESIIREKPIHGENLLEHTLSGNLAGGEKSLHPNTHGTLTLNAYEKQETDSRTLENVATREDSLVSDSHLITFKGRLQVPGLKTSSYLPYQMIWSLRCEIQMTSSNHNQIYNHPLQTSPACS